jgi:YbbR domain-containing protein
VIDKCAAVIFFANVNINNANSTQQMDYKVQSHDLGNLPCSYYYVKKVLQVVRLVINIRVKERVYIFNL